MHSIQLPQREYRVPLPLVGYSVLLAISRVSTAVTVHVMHPASFASLVSLASLCLCASASSFFSSRAGILLVHSFCRAGILQCRSAFIPCRVGINILQHRSAFVPCRVGILQLIGLRSFPAEQVSYSLSFCVHCGVGILQLIVLRSFSVE
jgi:hypothetical protein